jgi:hypothetical protein
MLLHVDLVWDECHSELAKWERNVTPRWLSLRGMAFQVSSVRGKCYSLLTQPDGNAIQRLAQWEGNVTRYSALTQSEGNGVSSELSEREMLLRVDSVWGEYNSELAQYKGVSFRADLV